MKSLISTLAALGFAVAANAATPIQSEFFYQAETDNNVLTPELTYDTMSIKAKGGGKMEVSGQVLNLTYERGINDMFSAGATIGYTTTSNETTGSADEDTKGLNDITFFGKGRYAFTEDGSMHYGANLHFSPSDKETDSTGTTTEVDAVSGGNTLQPWVGYQWLFGSNVFGLKLQMDMALGDRTLKTKGSTAKTTETGGETTEFSLFYEMPHEMGAVGFVGFYQTVTETETKTSGTTTKGDDDYTLMGLGVYSPYKFSETAEVIGELTYSTITSDFGTTKLDSSSDLQISVAGRFMF
ncbi:MAG: hypothetical protein H6624_11255 [Bdellovibrionaceae bacterium]|nr:hypothetical protein [Bdellovibrionales bacterium]MCB9084915.1 hypothetical protein [Pseudobdellovibrionaceae bacterium]